MSTDDRLFTSVRDLVRAVIDEQRLRLAGVFEYTIKAVNGAPPDVTIDADPNDPTLGLPGLSAIEMMPAIDGITSLPDVGTVCHIAFVNRDPSKPMVVACGSLGINPVARLGDQVMLFLPPSAPINGVINGSSPFVGTISIASPTSGIITQGSPKVFSG